MLLNVRHQCSAAHIGNYLEYQNFQYDQWRYILKVLYKKVGLFKEAMDLQIKETRVAAWLQLELDEETRGSEMEGVPIYMMYSSFYIIRPAATVLERISKNFDKLDQIYDKQLISLKRLEDVMRENIKRDRRRKVLVRGIVFIGIAVFVKKQFFGASQRGQGDKQEHLDP
ncbi:uncharacterized protein LOC120679189 isoform X1 [Panicum virgatum]|uniref:uncharacterized protein LOC120679189 isoform X1 n=1 Tax=Panicum virgatum TaxID=38727 RepID=UPI0019D62F49|nr:uncharacterized protein LOC120679189 isoform X1 [Panicum virgatum]XP_039816652.1 uncharacterized protein LOC120679189 isoform X1 [Panicum virgatum]XP_039816653.1 uncharacterized protein LOC120679189 isoform X1 [Panicum virgatum]